MAQNPIFSEISTRSSYFSPAHGLDAFSNNRKAEIGIRYRDQWSKVGNPAYRSYLLESNLNLYKSNKDAWNGGLFLLNDRSNSGLLRLTTVQLSAVYSRKISGRGKNYTAIRAGSSISFNQTNINTEDLWFGRQYDQTKFEISPTTSDGETLLGDNNNYFNINIGFYWEQVQYENMKMSLSGALKNLNRPDVGFITNNNLGNTIFGQFNFEKKQRKNLWHKISMATLIQQPSVQLIPSYGVIYDISSYETVNLLANVSTRITNSSDSFSIDAVIFNIGMSSDTWAGSFSYDLNISSLANHIRGNGSLEISLAYLIDSDF